LAAKGLVLNISSASSVNPSLSSSVSKISPIPSPSVSIISIS